jgi:uncharacterized phage protein (TIGR01671 family)|uniref:YopX protein n=1 Tax=Siphoviridae sp. ctylc9 TaxID=2827977 RepID=A0A8S5S8K8_9CAUD|nr:MAG TPA: YopX protein [Siphoviridae sp. ctylc9]
MNREIKFRIWDKYEKQMYPISSIDYDIFSQEIRIIAIGHKNGMCTSYNKNHNSEKCDITALELMQYTGLHDKNGKEIYEGDIVGDNKIKWIVKWNKHRMGFSLYPTTEQLYDEMPINVENKLGFKILGNIYDNPELLGGE